MTRIAPERFPDRLAFERHARELRREECARLAAAASAWVRARFAALAHSGANPAPSADARH